MDKEFVNIWKIFVFSVVFFRHFHRGNRENCEIPSFIYPVPWPIFERSTSQIQVDFTATLAYLVS
jgi:hypothetical protein